ncbi:hypothetical protein ZIOFF_035347 [Zingiber officinale]|uniref:Uncharacterized protein n=1 Tax=Zingiber officinale TaxID=94328 RepID=A0A8J5G961_ZINOF|nr:hypothetical protein ZIOFF_035347 [Zingiber officinale]
MTASSPSFVMVPPTGRVVPPPTMTKNIDGKPTLATACPAGCALGLDGSYNVRSSLHPLEIPPWFSDSYIINSNHSADSFPGFGSKPRADSSPNSKEAPLWKDVNFAYANLPSPSVEPHPSQLESSEAVQVKSVFTRSYALMESMFKFYIYHDEPKPMFHRPWLKSIYYEGGF